VPTIPAALIAALATVNLGAVHAVVFGGFAAKPLSERIEDAKPRVIMTTSCGIEGSKGPLAYRPLVEGAIERSKFKPDKVLVWDRDELPWGQLDQKSGQRDWRSLVKHARSQGNRVSPVPVKSHDSLYIIYTSGMCTPCGIMNRG
jgi:propionyl-CoA synthetase